MCGFATEVAGVPEIGAIGRGENMEITTYLEKAMESELGKCYRFVSSRSFNI